MLPIYLLSSVFEDFTLLITDEFLKLNGRSLEFVNSCRNNLLETINSLNNIYRLNPKILLCSDFMKSREYLLEFESVKKSMNRELEQKLLETVPDGKKHLGSSREYPIHELSCVEYLVRKGFELKIGPNQEKQYDEIMQALDFKISFAYLLDAYSLSKSSDKIVHYVPNSRGANNGQRIFFGENERVVTEKLRQGGDDSLRYFCKIASVSGHILGGEYKSLEEISSLNDKKLRSETIRIVLGNIVKPFNEAA